jgi:hypothetical protein
MFGFAGSKSARHELADELGLDLDFNNDTEAANVTLHDALIGALRNRRIELPTR